MGRRKKKRRDSEDDLDIIKEVDEEQNRFDADDLG